MGDSDDEHAAYHDLESDMRRRALPDENAREEYFTPASAAFNSNKIFWTKQKQSGEELDQVRRNLLHNAHLLDNSGRFRHSSTSFLTAFAPLRPHDREPLFLGSCSRMHKIFTTCQGLGPRQSHFRDAVPQVMRIYRYTSPVTLRIKASIYTVFQIMFACNAG